MLFVITFEMVVDCSERLLASLKAASVSPSSEECPLEVQH